MYKNNPKYRSSLYKCGRYYLCLNTDLAATPPLPPKCKHCCNPYQYCGGEVKLTFAAKKPELAVGLACHPRAKRGALGKSIVAKCNVYKEFTTLVAANLTAR